MAEVDLEIGGRRYAIACRDGEEAHFRRLAAIIDEKMRRATDAVGGLNEVRQFLFASLLLADALEETPATPAAGRDTAQIHGTAPPAGTDPAIIDAIERIAGRLEALADLVDGGVESARTTS